MNMSGFNGHFVRKVAAVGKKRFKGSYTVEVAFIMAFVLWAIMVSIQAAYCLRDETAGAMALQEAVQRLSHGEEMAPEEAREAGLRKAGHPFAWEGYEFQLERKGNIVTGWKVYGVGKAGNWSLEINQDVFEPENFLRKISLLDQEG